VYVLVGGPTVTGASISTVYQIRPISVGLHGCRCERVMRARRLEDRIRGLCGHALIAGERELNAIVSELRFCLREHARRLREKTLDRLVRGEFKERRCSQTHENEGQSRT
jgi:hypothetical protein